MALEVLEWNKNYLFRKLGGSIHYFNFAERMTVAFAPIFQKSNISLVRCCGALWTDLIKLQLAEEYPLT